MNCQLGNSVPKVTTSLPPSDLIYTKKVYQCIGGWGRAQSASKIVLIALSILCSLGIVLLVKRTRDEAPCKMKQWFIEAFTGKKLLTIPINGQSGDHQFKKLENKELSDPQFDKRIVVNSHPVCSQFVNGQVIEPKNQGVSNNPSLALQNSVSMPKEWQENGFFQRVFKQLGKETCESNEELYVDSNGNPNFRFTEGNLIKETRIQPLKPKDPVYLHANYVELGGIKFILTQYPLLKQVPLLWDLIKKEVCLIVDLTNDRDMELMMKRRGETAPYTPCLNQKLNWEEIESYWQQKNQSKHPYKKLEQKEVEALADGFMKKNEVNCISETMLDSTLGKENKLCCYNITEADSNMITQVPRLHFKNWPDKGLISKSSLNHIISICESRQVKSEKKHILIHCRAGLGRSGVLAIAYALSQSISNQQVSEENLDKTIRSLVISARKARGSGIVQTVEQLEFLYEWAWENLQLMRGVS